MARPVPADLEDALAASPAARERFWSMPSQQKDAWVAWVGRARFPGARRRRVVAAVRRLGGRRELAQGVVPLPRDWSALIVGLLLLAGLAAFVVWLTVFRDHDHSRPSAVVVTAKATVPKVTGIRYQSAQFQLKESKLTVRLVRRNATRPRGIVIAQRPQDGATVPQGTPVALVVSNGPPKVQLPDVVGLAAADAVRALQARKLVPKLEQRPSAQPPGTVLAQQPRPGSHTKPGNAVTLQVAAPQATTSQTTTAQATTTQATTTHAVTTTRTTTTTRQQTTTGAGLKPPPSGNDYTGTRLSQTVQRIADGRQQVTVTYVTSSQPAGVVVANSRVGSRERLQVSAGPHPAPGRSVPDVSGEDSATAQQDLQAAGFAVVTVDWPVSDPASDGVVVAETPGAGTSVPRGAAVVVYIGSATGG